MRAPALLAIPLFLLSGCPTDEVPEPTPDPALGLDPAVRVGPGEARAGMIRDGEAGSAAMFAGIAAEARPGDFVLYNDRIRVVIEGPRQGNGYVEAAGGIIDADLVRPPGVLGRDTVDDIFTSLGAGRVIDAQVVAVVRDGSDGGPAVVRVTGKDIPWAFIEGAVEATSPILEDQGLEVITDYELAPDSWTVRVTTTFNNVGFTESRFNVTDGIMAADELLQGWAANEGIGQSADEFEAVGAVGRTGEATLSLWHREHTLRSLGVEQLASSAGLNLVSHGWETLPIGASRTVERHWTVAPDPVTAEAERLRARGQELGALAGTVTADGAAVAAARVHFVAGDNVAGYALTDAEGRWAAELPPGDYLAIADALGGGELVDLPPGAGHMSPYAPPPVADRVLEALRGDGPARAVSWGHPVPAAVPVTVSATPSTLDLQVPPASALRVTVEDDSGASIPALIEVRRVGDAPIAADVLPLVGRLDLDAGSRAARAWTADGDMEMALPPGSYVVDVHHSWRHERALAVPAELVAGSVAEVAVVLEEVVPRDGRLAMDSHLHAAPSNDADIAMEDRLIQCAAFGVDVPVTTDHDRRVDYAPLASALGLDARMTVVPGVEVSPVLRGHVNAFPAPETDAPNGGAEPWWVIPETTDELYQRIRAGVDSDIVLHANHPRDGLFEFAGWTPDGGIPQRADFWTWDFDAFELVNGKRAGSLGDIRVDWFSFLDRGRSPTPTGVSDSHGHGSPCGYGRTDLLVGADGPAAVPHEAIRDAVLAGATVVALGLTLDASLSVGGDTSAPGGTVVGTAGEVRVTVRAPSWIVPDTVRVWRNGEIVIEQPVGEPVEGVWFDDALAVEAEVDSWFVVEVVGATPLGGYFGDGFPYAAANAFFVDVDGDGFTGPKE